MLLRLKEWAIAEPARVREAIRALIIVGAVVLGVTADSEVITSLVTVGVMLVSVLLQEDVRSRVTPLDTATDKPLNPDYQRVDENRFETEVDVDGVY